MQSDIKRLIENFFSLSLLKLCNLILPLVTLPYLIKTLSVGTYGVIVMSLSIAMYFQTLIEYGFNLSATRDIARNRENKRRLDLIYSKVIISKIFLLIISLILLYVVLMFLPNFNENRLTYILIGLILIGYAIFPEWFFRGVEEMRYIALLDFTVKISFTIGVFLFIKSESELWLYPAMLGGAYIIVSIISHFIILTRFKVKFKLVKLTCIKKTLIKTFPLFVNQFFPNLYNNTTTFLVGLILGNYAVGVYGAIKQIVSALNVFNSVSTTVLYPYLNRNKHHFKKFSKFYLIILFLISLMFILMSGPILSYLNIDDSNSVIIFSILVFGVFNIGIYSVFSTNYLLTYNKDRLVMKVTIFTSVIGFILSFPLIYFSGLLGAAINVFFCQLLLASISFVFYIKHRKLIDL